MNAAYAPHSPDANHRVQHADEQLQRKMWTSSQLMQYDQASEQMQREALVKLPIKSRALRLDFALVDTNRQDMSGSWMQCISNEAPFIYRSRPACTRLNCAPLCRISSRTQAPGSHASGCRVR